jgi:hypothetical protein
MQPCSARLNVHQTTRSQTGRSNGATARARTHEHVHSSFLLCVQLRYNRDCTVRAPINCITALLTDPHNELSAHSVWICVVWCGVHVPGISDCVCVQAFAARTLPLAKSRRTSLTSVLCRHRKVGVLTRYYSTIYTTQHPSIHPSIHSSLSCLAEIGSR